MLINPLETVKCHFDFYLKRLRPLNSAYMLLETEES